MRNIIILTRHNLDQPTLYSRTAKVFKSMISNKYIIREVFLEDFDATKIEAKEFRDGPFYKQNTNFFKRVFVEDKKFQNYLSEQSGFFINSAIIVFEPEVLVKLPNFILKETRICYVQASSFELANNPKLLHKFANHHTLSHAFDYTVTSHLDDNVLMKLAFPIITNNFKSIVSYSEIKEDVDTNSKTDISFYGKFDNDIIWEDVIKFSETVGKKSKVYSWGKDFLRCSTKYACANLEFIDINDITIEEVFDKSCLFYPMESHNLNQYMVESFANGVPILSFKHSEYLSKLLGNNLERGIITDPSSNDQKSIVKYLNDKDFYHLFCMRCINFAKKHFNKEVFQDHISIILKGLTK